MSRKIKIKLTRWGIASRVGNTIYLNEDLIHFPALCDAILDHEGAHTSHYSLKDILLDIRGLHLKGHKKEYYKFIFQHPRAMVEGLPLWIYEKKVVVNPLILAAYGLAFLIAGGIGWILTL